MFVPNLFSNVEAFTGKTSIEDNEALKIPGMNGSFMAFYIASDSMAPTLVCGDMVMCTAIENLNELSDNQICAVIIGNNAFVRRIRRVLDFYGNVTHLQLFTENSNQFAFSTYDIKNISKILKVSNRMSSIGD